MNKNVVESNIVDKKLIRKVNKQLKGGEKAFNKRKTAAKTFLALTLGTNLIGNGLIFTGVYFANEAEKLERDILMKNNYVVSEEVAKDDFIKLHDEKGFLKIQDFKSLEDSFVLAGTASLILSVVNAGVGCVLVNDHEESNQNQLLAAF